MGVQGSEVQGSNGATIRPGSSFQKQTRQARTWRAHKRNRLRLGQNRRALGVIILRSDGVALVLAQQHGQPAFLAGRDGRGYGRIDGRGSIRGQPRRLGGCQECRRIRKHRFRCPRAGGLDNSCPGFSRLLNPGRRRLCRFRRGSGCHNHFWFLWLWRFDGRRLYGFWFGCRRGLGQRFAHRLPQARGGVSVRVSGRRGDLPCGGQQHRHWLAGGSGRGLDFSGVNRRWNGRKDDRVQHEQNSWNLHG